MSELKIKFQDFAPAYEELKIELDQAYARFMRSGWYVLGPEVNAFETEYATYCDAEHCVGVGHGLDALHLALRACGVGAGDEVIVPSNTYIATWLAVTQAGAVPVPVEPHPGTFNINPQKVEEAIGTKTRVIMPVNLYGQAADYDHLLELARDRGLKVVVDNAQAHGARYKGRRVGGLADIECHSFYPTKNLGAFGEGGAVTTNQGELAERVRVLRNYGSRVRYHNEVAGYNSRLDELQAAFLRVKLARLDEWNRRRTAVASSYLDGLRDIPGLVLPRIETWNESVWHLFVIQHPDRDRLRSYLEDQGIQTLIHYPIPPHRSGAYADGGWRERPLPIAERLAATILSLPIHPHLGDEAVRSIIGSVRGFHQEQ
jgi:dTDP-4-amino-4,6-dideoxygalactose transaminase